MTETTELDTTKEEQPGANGHSDEEWLELDDLDFIKHIAEQKPVEELVAIPEWQMKVLCKALPAPERFAIHALAYDPETKITDYKKALFEVLLAGCFNPKTGHRAFRESHKALLMQPQHGAAVERLYLTIMRISRMFVSQQETARKN